MSSASVTVERDLDWMDTDAAGIWHYSTALRFIEHAEFELHRALGIEHRTFGHSPRVRVEVEYLSPVTFPAIVTTTLQVVRVGNASVAYEATLRVADREVARGSFTSVLVREISDGAEPLDEELRSALTTGRPQG